jgi:hypothetical protein
MASPAVALEETSQEILQPPRSKARRRFDAEFEYSRDAVHLILPRAVIGDDDRHDLSARLVGLEKKVQARGGKIGFSEDFDGGVEPLPYDLPRNNPALDLMIDEARNTHTEYLRIGALKDDALETVTLVMRRSYGQKTKFTWMHPGEQFASGQDRRGEEGLPLNPITHPETIRDTMDGTFPAMERYLTRRLSVTRMPKPAPILVPAPETPIEAQPVPNFPIPMAS